MSVVMLDKRHVWVVEVKLSDDKQWEPTIGVGIMRGDVTDLIKGWKKANPGAQFRTVRYTSGGEDQAYLA